AATEAGPADDVQAELDLVQLRGRVAVLQQILDARAIENGEEPAASRTVEPAPAPVTERSRNTAANAPTTVEPTVPARPHVLKVAFEADGFVADRSRLGRACWRGGRYLEGVAALEPLAGEPQSDYWRARCLEKLARNTEACALYRHVIEIAGSSPEGRSAREDLEFLEWSLLHGVTK
ncbi:MAG TPA: hypothetical protein VM509_05890, partial [Planctomycetota bacterium]|nr:hypothetical protein [Planctomycetota bacterium]